MPGYLATNKLSSQLEVPVNRLVDFAFDMGDGKVAIPYGPYSIEKVMVYNGTSFACGALGCYLGQFSGALE